MGAGRTRAGAEGSQWVESKGRAEPGGTAAVPARVTWVPGMDRRLVHHLVGEEVRSWGNAMAPVRLAPAERADFSLLAGDFLFDRPVAISAK